VSDPSLPGADLVEQGLSDLASGRETPEALLVAIGAPRLRALGVKVPEWSQSLTSPEHRLYEALERLHCGRPHSEYNALIRRLVSYERAAEHAASAARRVRQG